MTPSNLMSDTVAKKRNSAGPLDVRFELRLDEATAERVQQQADRLGVSMASYLRMATVRQLERDEADEARSRDETSDK